MKEPCLYSNTAVSVVTSLVLFTNVMFDVQNLIMVCQVRGVGAGGIVSSSFCLLYKLFTLKLTRKQLIGLCTHTDSPFIRGIGLMYARSVVSTLTPNFLSLLVKLLYFCLSA